MDQDETQGQATDTSNAGTIEPGGAPALQPTVGRGDKIRISVERIGVLGNDELVKVEASHDH